MGHRSFLPEVFTPSQFAGGRIVFINGGCKSALGKIRAAAGSVSVVSIVPEGRKPIARGASPWDTITIAIS
jgi:hypothetical protein